MINDLGQSEVLYDPGEEVIQGKDTSELPTQLEAVIDKIDQIFQQSDYILPEALVTQSGRPDRDAVCERNERKKNGYPAWVVDIPSRQTQEIYNYDLVKASHTAIFASPGYGKSTILQTITMNLSRQNTPEQIHFHLLDFGNNGLLPLKICLTQQTLSLWRKTKSCKNVG